MATAVNDKDISKAGVRDVTDDEITHFDEHGWALLKGLVSPDLAAAMLERGKRQLGGLAEGQGERFTSAEAEQEKWREILESSAGEATVTQIDPWVEWRGPVRFSNDEVMRKVALSPAMGRNAQRLLGRDRAMRIYHDILNCKLPEGGSKPTHWHQDATNMPLDRNFLTIWVALAEISPQQGPVQFYSGSHRWGMLGRTHPENEYDLREEYPELASLQLSPAHHLQPGDCTVHHEITVHGTGTNMGRNPR